MARSGHDVRVLLLSFPLAAHHLRELRDVFWRRKPPECVVDHSVKLGTKGGQIREIESDLFPFVCIGMWLTGPLVMLTRRCVRIGMWKSYDLLVVPS